MPGVIIEVSIPTDRNVGTLTIKQQDGTVLLADIKVLGRAALGAAQAHGNGERSPLQPFGHTPLGTYNVTQIFSTGTGTPYSATVYGPNGAIRLDPVSGDAYVAKLNGRTGILIHAGRDNGPSAPLVSTNGCLRIKNADMQTIINVIVANSSNAAQNRCEAISISVSVENPDTDESANEPDPPPTDPGLPIILP